MRPRRQLHLADAEATRRFAQQLAAAWPRPLSGVIWLRGDLGAGKTELARAFLRALGVSGTIRSPTYTLLEHYDCVDGAVLHMDCYRIAEPSELGMLGLDDTPPESTLWLVEWPERAAGSLPEPTLELALASQGSGRQLQLAWPDNSGLREILQTVGE